jgi:hypothetical protein
MITPEADTTYLIELCSGEQRRWHYLGPEHDNSALIQIPECVFPDIGYIAGDFLFAQLGVPGNHFKFFDVYGCINTFANQTLSDKDRIFKIVSAPWHKRHCHILAKRQFSFICGGTISDDFTGLHKLAAFDNRPVIKTRILIGPDEFG